MAPKVILGPVIGIVDQTSARILLEIDVDAEVKIQLVPNQPTVRGWWGRSAAPRSQSQVTEFELDADTLPFVCRTRMTANRAAAFAFSSLKPGTCYTVQILGADPQEESPGTPLRSSFTTMPENLQDRTDFKFLTLSCNDISCSVTGTTNAWEALWDVVQKGDIMFLAHIGDQVYSDSGLKDVDRAKMETWQTRIDPAKPGGAYAEAIGMLQDLPHDAAAWEARRNDICEAYRRVYRATWNDPFTKRVLATVPNIMVTDDHEFRDDWGDLNGVVAGQVLGGESSTSDLQPTNPASFISSCALQVTVACMPSDIFQWQFGMFFDD